jgi:hypothetical protein
MKVTIVLCHWMALTLESVRESHITKSGSRISFVVLGSDMKLAFASKLDMSFARIEKNTIISLNHSKILLFHSQYSTHYRIVKFTINYSKIIISRYF